MASPHTHDNAVRIHDEALYRWLGGFTCHYPRINVPGSDLFIPERKSAAVLRVFAAPSRAAAKLVDTIVRQNWVPTETGEALRKLVDDAVSILPVPAIAIQRNPPRIDREEANPAGYWRKKFFNAETQQWEFWRWPKPYLTDYIVTFLARNRYTEAFFLEWLQSKFGNVGSLVNETFIPILHKAPFGTINQRLRLTADPSDLSDLEASEDERLIRLELTLELRTWVTMPKLIGDGGTGDLPSSDPCAGDVTSEIGNPIWYIRKSYEIGVNVEVDRSTFYWTDNLYHGLIANYDAATLCRTWITTGDGEIRALDRSLRSFEIKVSGSVDSVELLGFGTDLSVRDVSLISLSADYRSDADVQLQLEQDMPEEGSVAERILNTTVAKSTDGHFHKFIVANKSIITGRWRGIDPAVLRTLTLSHVDLRVIGVQTNPIIGTAVAVGGGMRYDFYNLTAGKPYLLVLESGASGGPQTLVASDDIVTPQFQRSEVFNAADQSAGAALLIESRTGTASLFIPTGVTINKVWAQRYDGHYHGNGV